MALSGDIDKAIRKAVTELQYQYLDEAQELAGSACQKSYTCLVTGGYVRKALQQSQINNCATQENRTYNLRCVLTQEAKKRGWISADGTTMTYPDSAFSFGRSDEYNSWWIDVE